MQTHGNAGHRITKSVSVKTREVAFFSGAESRNERDNQTT